MTSAELKECVDRHEKNQSRIAEDLGFTTSKMSRACRGTHPISASDEKLLRLYFYELDPFKHLKNGHTR